MKEEHLHEFVKLADHVTANNLDEFKIAYKKAYSDDKKSFVFKGQELLTAYAKYLIEYLETLKRQQL